MILKAGVEIDYDEKNEEVRGVELVLPCGDHKTVARDLTQFIDPGVRMDLCHVLSYWNADALQFMCEKQKEELKIENQLTNKEM